MINWISNLGTPLLGSPHLGSPAQPFRELFLSDPATFPGLMVVGDPSSENHRKIIGNYRKIIGNYKKVDVFLRFFDNY